MRRRYKSRRTYINAKRRKEYNRYVKTFEAKKKALEEKGLTPYDSIKYSYSEYFAERKFKKEEGSVNVQRDIIQQQLYKYSYKSTVALRKAMKERGIEEGSWSLAKIRSGEEFDLSFLSDVNEELKKLYPKMSGKERAKWISKEWFGYAS